MEHGVNKLLKKKVYEVSYAEILSDIFRSDVRFWEAGNVKLSYIH